jgi:hypothetical protein
MNVRELILLVWLGPGASAWLHAQSGAAVLVRHAPTINGTVEGSVQQILGESVTLNGSAAVSGDLLVPGTPAIRLNGHPTYAGTIDGTGSASPAGYQVTLNGNASLRHVIRRTDPVALPRVGPPAAPAGTRNVALNKSGQNPGDFATIRNLSLNSNMGQIAVPPGVYGDFTANGGSGFTLGVAGATQPASYALQHLTLNGNARLEIAGPVELTLANAVTFNGDAGSADHSAWLRLKVARDGVTLIGGSSLAALVTAPNSTVVINGNSKLAGALACDRLTLNGNGLLRLVAGNQPPTVIMTAPSDGASVIAFTAFTLTATVNDADGTVSRVEFFNGTTELGDGTPRAGSPSTFDFGLSTGLPVGTCAFTAKATDDQGASTISAPVTISVTLAPNAPPQVTLTAPAAGITLAADTAVTLSATATDADGTVAKIEFFDGAAKLGETSTPTSTSTYDLTLAAGLLPGNRLLLARATDDDGAFADSAAVAVTVLATVPYAADFEAAEGYALGSLAGQLGWSVTQGAARVADDAFFSGARSVVLLPGTPPGKIAQAFAPLAGQDVVFVDFFAKPVAEADITASTTFDIGSSRLALWRTTAGQGELRAFNGDGQGGGRWKDTAFTAPLAADGSTQDWVRFTTRLDFAHKSWDLYANGTMAAADLGFRDNASSYLASFAVQGDATAASRLDYLLAAPQNPLFADANNDGIDDAWESAHGLDLAVNDRNSDPDGDGLTNLQEFIRDTDPTDYFNGTLPVLTSQLDASGQPGPSGLVVVRVTSPDGTALVNAPLTFAVTTGSSQMSVAPGGPALLVPVVLHTDAQGLAGVYLSFTTFAPEVVEVTAQSQSRSTSLPIIVNPPLTDHDGNGLPDLWEVTYFGQTGTDPTADPDHDGLTNLQEYQQKTDPTDYYNGALPQLQPLGGTDDQLASDGSLTVMVTNAAGQPLVNAPGTFKVKTGGHLLSLSPNGPWTTEVQVTTDANGKAKVYVKAGTN